MVDLHVHLGKQFSLINPVMTASGTFGYGDEVADLVPVTRFGALVTKSITLAPRAGNPPPRITETPYGMINSIGLANIGLEAFLREKAEFLASYPGKVIVNVAGRSENEYHQIVAKLNEVDWVAACEINVSCPNVSEGGIEFGKSPDVLDKLVTSLRKVTKKFLIVKLTPNVTDIGEIAGVVESAGADAITLINTVYGAAIDIETRRPKINTIIGGLSGPAIKPIALANIIRVAKRVQIPIIGVGGITNGADVIEFLLAGASAVQLGSVNFFKPLIINEIIDYLVQYCEEHSIDCIGKLIGQAEI